MGCDPILSGNANRTHHPALGGDGPRPGHSVGQRAAHRMQRGLLHRGSRSPRTPRLSQAAEQSAETVSIRGRAVASGRGSQRAGFDERVVTFPNEAFGQNPSRHRN